MCGKAPGLPGPGAGLCCTVRFAPLITMNADPAGFPASGAREKPLALDARGVRSGALQTALPGLTRCCGYGRLLRTSMMPTPREGSCGGTVDLTLIRPNCAVPWSSSIRAISPLTRGVENDVPAQQA